MFPTFSPGTPMARSNKPGTSLSAQARYAAGTREILECYFEGRTIRDEYMIVDGGKLPGTGTRSHASGNATGGSAEEAKFSEPHRDDTHDRTSFRPVPFIRWRSPRTRAHTIGHRSG